MVMGRKHDGPLLSPVSIAPPSYSIPSSFARKIADVPKAHHGFYECIQTFLGSIIGCVGAYVPCCACFNPFTVVPQGWVGLVSHFGKVYKIIDPGLYFINRNTESIDLVDVTITISDIPRQVVMTRDNVSVDIDSVLYWHVIDPFVAKYHVRNVEMALMERTMTTLKDSVGAHDLQSIIAHRDTIASEIKGIIEPAALSWGVAVEAILIKDLSFSKDLQEHLSSAAKQKRIGESKVIAAAAEVQSAKLMREASDILNTQAAMQIRYLETLQAMSRAAATKVIFMPLSGDSYMRDVSQRLAIEQQQPDEESV